MSNTMENNSNNNDNNINNLALNTKASCSTKQKETRYLIDLNETPPSPDYSQGSANGCLMETGGDAEAEVEKLKSDFSFPKSDVAEEEEEEEEVDVNAMVENVEIVRARKGKMAMKYSEGATDDEVKIVPSDVQVPNTPSDDEAIAVRGMMLLQHDDVVGASGSSCLQRKRKKELSEKYKAPFPVMGDGKKIVLRVESEENILDDGYDWRKYGCKEIKGNSYNPRAYYRCSLRSCNIKKKVERDGKDPKYLLVSYEGKHNHDLPSSNKKRPTSTTAVGGMRPVNEQGCCYASAPIATTQAGPAPVFPLKGIAPTNQDSRDNE